MCPHKDLRKNVQRQYWGGSHSPPVAFLVDCPNQWPGPARCCSALDSSSLLGESEVAQSCPTLQDPMDYILPGSSVHGIFQARVLEWVAISFSRGSSRCRDWTRVSCTAGRRFTLWATRETTLGEVIKSVLFCALIVMLPSPLIPLTYLVTISPRPFSLCLLLYSLHFI